MPAIDDRSVPGRPVCLARKRKAVGGDEVDNTLVIVHEKLRRWKQPDRAVDRQMPTIGSPPFGQRSWPVMKFPLGPTRKAIHSAISSGSAHRFTRFSSASAAMLASP